MNSPRNHARCVCASMFALVCGTVLSAGVLNPPAGPVVGTMKTLSEVEPRTVINDANTPGNGGYQYVISQPGSYILPGNMVVTKGIGISIQSSNVTIDLNGFTISKGAGVTAQYAVNCFTDGQGAWSNITIRNGRITGAFSDCGVSSDADGTAVEDLVVSGVPNYGIGVSYQSAVRRCIVKSCVNGVAASLGTVEDCTISGCSQSGISTGSGVVRDCLITDCATGVFVYGQSVVEGCTLRNNGVGGGYGVHVNGVGARIDNNSISGSYFGILIGSGATDNLVTRNTIRKGGATGAIIMNGQVNGSYPNNHVAAVVADPAAGFSSTNALANIQY